MSARVAGRLDFAEIEAIRRTPGRSTLLFLTDRCPVGCAHCSVDSRRDSPTISDHELFRDIVDWLCAREDLEVVGISGGEPFVERRGLTLAVHRLQEAGKKVVLYTSGVWARNPRPPAWVQEILELATTTFLSTDAFHQRGIADATYVNAARAVSAAGNWIIVQVVDLPSMVAKAKELLRTAFGERYAEHAELKVNPLLLHGRGAGLASGAPPRPGREFGPCTAIASPIVRYDGVVTGCCNESVIMGLGPSRLRRKAASGAEVGAAIDAFRSDQMLRAIGGAGPGALTVHPRYADLAGQPFRSICDLCWKMLDRTAEQPAPDPLVEAINTVLTTPP